MDILEQYERFKSMKQTPDIVFIRKRLEAFINRTKYIDLVAAQLSEQVDLLEQMSEELTKEEQSIRDIILRINRLPGMN